MNKTGELAYWINERERMRIRKENPPGLYGIGRASLDPAMSDVRYCNVHREDDRVTRWVAKNWRTPMANHPDLTLAMVTARMINWPATLEAIGIPTGGTLFSEWAERSKRIIRRRQDEGHKTWTSAYTISTCGRSIPKEDYVFDHVLSDVSELPWEWKLGDTLAHAWDVLTCVDGLGSFLAAQVVADLKNTPGHPLGKAADFWTWSAPGPGSLRGLEAYFGKRTTKSTYQKDIALCYNEVRELIDRSIHPTDMHMQDFQNCLCEFSKYIRVKEGDGRVRNKYPPG